MKKQYQTSYEEMIENREVWEKCIKNSTSLLEALYNIDTSNYFLAKYIHVLFGMRTLCDTKIDFAEFISECESRKLLDAYEFHKHLRRFMADIDSVLDYTDKLYKELKEKDSLLFEFNRKNSSYKDFSNEVSNIRNSLLHEGVPTLSTTFIDSNRSSSTMCHANVAGYNHFDYNIYIKVIIKDSEEKNYEVRTLIDRQFNTIEKLLNNLTYQLTDIFNNYPKVLEEE